MMTNTAQSRARGSIRIARALWYTAPESAEIRSERLAPAPPGTLTIETHYSTLSRGTERLIWSGRVPAAEWQRMRAPFQAGDFPFPVKYGYSAAGVVVNGPEAWHGAHVFALYPHQDVFQLPADRVIRLAEGLPLRRAVLAANMETALNAIWDSGAGPGCSIVVVGAGVVGALVAFLASRMPGTSVDVIDVAPGRRALIEALGATFHLADGDGDAARAVGDTIGNTSGHASGHGADYVFHTSASAGGLKTAIAACGFEATLVEMSWYGDREISVGLGGAFHSKRLRLISSQVGHVAANRRARWDYTRRLETAARLLDDEALDRLAGETIAFDALPGRMASIFEDGQSGLSPIIAYPAAG